MTRKNRYDWEDDLTQRVLEHPEQWTRATRRSLGIRIRGVQLLPQGVEAPDFNDLPRYVRRNFMALAGTDRTRRARKRRARIARAMAPYGGLA